VAFFLAFFSGTTWGAGASSPVRRASAGSSGNGAGQIVCSAFASQSCQRQREFRSRIESNYENKYPVDDLDYVDEFELLVHHVLNTRLESGQLSRTTPGQALLLLGGEPRGEARSELGGRCPFRVTRLGDVEPP
jgi:hypothetical protein